MYHIAPTKRDIVHTGLNAGPYIVLPTEKDVVHGSHKYIDRVMGKNGKWRYIYSRAASKVKNAGSNIKSKLDQANSTVRKGINTASRAVGVTQRKRMKVQEKLLEDARKNNSDEERERYDSTWRKLHEDARKAASTGSKKLSNKLHGKASVEVKNALERDRAVINRRSELNKAKKAYLKTPLGQLEDTVTYDAKQAKKTANKVAKTVKKTAKKVTNDISRTTRKKKTTNKGNSKSQYTPGYSKRRR